MESDETQNEPAKVQNIAKQAGELRARWAWTEESVWTERMLGALERGLKGGKWFSLIDKVFSVENLQSAFKKVKANDGAAGVDQVTPREYGKNLATNLAKLSQQLREGTYKPQAIRRKWIPKADGSSRPLGIPTVRDRVVQTALRNVLEPIFERGFADQSYGFRPGRGCKDALRRVDALLEEGARHVVDADLKAYFDTIPHGALMARVEEQVSDGKVLALMRALVTQNVMDTAESWTPEKGTPQGAVISPLLANIYLNPLDHVMVQEGFEMVRYADDFVVLCRSSEEAHRALRIIEAWLQSAGLTLHPEKTRVIDADGPTGFEFLGYRFRRGFRDPRRKSVSKLKDVVRQRTRRTNGNSLAYIIGTLNEVLRGWFEYFKHCHHSNFERIDGWVRMRLRSILRKRTKRRGGAWRSNNATWRNAFFAAQGLFSLKQAHAQHPRPQRG